MVDMGTRLYLDLLQSSLMNLIYEDPPIRYPWEPSPDGGILGTFDRDTRIDGADWPSEAVTMLGRARMDNIRALTEDVLSAGTPGDLIETGVWRGGGTIYMRGILKAHGVTDRTVWVADSFQGFPDPGQEGVSARSFSSPELSGFLTGYRSEGSPAHAEASLDRVTERTSYDDVREHFERFGLLDDQVRFLRGWFRDTLPSAPIERLALLRLDGDLYDSTYDALDALYPRVSVGGYVIVDDYGTFSECREAVHDYLDESGTSVELLDIDGEAKYWQRES